MSPDMKLYQCTIAIQGSRDWVKPGMSAKVEILVKQLPDVVYVPIQAVTSRTGKQLVFLPGSKPREREVTTGEFNESFIEIRKGLEAGESVLLRLPDDERQAGEGEGAPAKPAPSPAGLTKPVAVR
jgi:multidrug efflux pump subunit AcrA (membrane-fusion protein)